MPELGWQCACWISVADGRQSDHRRTAVWLAGRLASIDLDQASIETAQRRASNMGLDNTTFDRADISQPLRTWTPSMRSWDA